MQLQSCKHKAEKCKAQLKTTLQTQTYKPANTKLTKPHIKASNTNLKTLQSCEAQLKYSVMKAESPNAALQTLQTCKPAHANLQACKRKASY